jgi:uncharacterized protein (DUF305 family)
MTTASPRDLADEVDLAAPVAEPVGLRRALLTVIAVALLVLAGTAGWLIRGGGSTPSGPATPGINSVDAGFARDMATHHTQAVTMAGYERDNTTSPELKILAFDIETSQQFQIGEMQGWLDNWGLSRNSLHPMAWMGHADAVVNGLMPGMATPAQMDRLESLHGKPLDILFLQLMIHHHQGGLPMAQYAVQHATEPYVRDLAQSMVNAQSSEIIQMEQLLRRLGGTPLPKPRY